MGVQNTGADGADAVEEDVEHEETEEEDREVEGLLRVLRREVLRARPVRREVHQWFGEDDPEDRQDGEERQDQGEEGIGEAPGVLFAVGGHAVDEERDEYRPEDAAHEEVVDQGRQAAGDGVGLCRHPGPEDGRHHRRPQEARQPREGGRYRGGEHRPQDDRHTGDTTAFFAAV